MHSGRISFLIVFCVFVFSACKIESDERWQHDAMGEIGDLAVFTDEFTWAKHGHLIDSVFAQAIPGMAGVEPFFEVRKSHEGRFEDYFKKNYNLFIILQRDRWPTVKHLFGAEMQTKIEEKFRSDGITVFKATDVWARPQEVHFVLVPNEEVLQESLKSKKASFLNQALETERKTTATTLIDLHPEKDTFLMDMLEKKGYGVRMPVSYRVGLESETCIGISRYMNAKKLGLYLYDEEYESKDQFSSDYIISRRNSVLKNHIKGSDRADSIPTFMSTDTLNVKLFRRQMELNGYYAIETRGWWEMENDFMAGPFVNYTIHCPKLNKVVTLDGNVFAPSHDKNKLIRQLEIIAATFTEK